MQLVDVRSRAEWLKGHLPGAISVPLLELDSRMQTIDMSKPSLVYCHEGYRATTAASILLRESSSNIGILIDGVEGWSALGLPLEVPTTKVRSILFLPCARQSWPRTFNLKTRCAFCPKCDCDDRTAPRSAQSLGKEKAECVLQQRISSYGGGAN